jgi:hypothetical protein
MDKKLSRLFMDMYEFLKTNDISYEEDNKATFKKMGSSLLKGLAKELPLKRSKVTYNPGGIAVIGDHRLAGEFPDGKCFEVYIAESPWGGGARKYSFMYRTLENFDTYNSGNNQWINFNDFTLLPEKLLSLCKQ